MIDNTRLDLWTGGYFFEVKIHEKDNLPRLAAIIPAYNESGRIENVVKVLCQVNILDEIIIVDDGSSDTTEQDAKLASLGDPRLCVVKLPSNRGKGEAVFAGWRATLAPFLLLLDADLINLAPSHVMALVTPVIEDEADMTMGLFRRGYWRTDLSHWLTPWLSGQRCLRADLLRTLPAGAASGFGLETSLSIAARRHGWRVARVPLLGVTHIPGELSIRHGLKGKLRMYAQVARAWFLSR